MDNQKQKIEHNYVASKTYSSYIYMNNLRQLAPYARAFEQLLVQTFTRMIFQGQGVNIKHPLYVIINIYKKP